MSENMALSSQNAAQNVFKICHQNENISYAKYSYNRLQSTVKTHPELYLTWSSQQEFCGFLFYSLTSHFVQARA